MDGRAFLDVARELVVGATEAHWRSAAGRGYYALMLECRDALRRWGMSPPSGQGVHSFVRLRFIYAAEPDLKKIGSTLEQLLKLRTNADYQLAASASFVSASMTQAALSDVADALALLGALEADPVRCSAVAAAIKAAWP